MKHLSPIIFAFILLSCGEEKATEAQLNETPTPCECYEAHNLQIEGQIAICAEKEKDEAFAHEVKKCQAADIMNVDVSEVDIPKAPSKKMPADGVYSWSVEESSIIWVGRNVIGKSHTGGINVHGGTITIENGHISSGDVLMDMTSIAPITMDDESASKLTDHLKSSDFFDVANFPQASFSIDSVSSIKLTAVIHGQLTIKGISSNESCQSAFSGSGENDIVFSGGIVFDRTTYDVEYNSRSLFDNLGDNTIEDEIRIKFDLVGKRKVLDI